MKFSKDESWGCGGRMKPEYYANEYRKYAQFCKSYPGAPVRRIAGGANADDYNWTETLMRNITLGNTWGISLHYYCAPTSNGKRDFATGFGEDGYFSALASCLHMEELLDKHAAIMDKYDPQKKVALVVDEWGISTEVETGTNPDFLYQQNSLRDALIAGTTLNIFNNHCDRVKMANLAQMVNVLQALILTQGDKMLLTPTYHVFDLYKVHHDAKLLPLKIVSPNYVFGMETIPAINASASIDSNHVTHISLVNLDPKNEIPVTINTGSIIFSGINGEILTSERFNDINTFENPNRVQIKSFDSFQKKDGSLIVQMPSKSVVVLELK